MTHRGFTISGPEVAVAAVPHLLGFRPTQSLVAVWSRDHQVVLTQRVDLPSPDADIDAFGHRFVEVARRASPDSVVCLCFVEADAKWHHGPLVDALILALDACEVDLLDVLIVRGSRFESALCDGGCCPPGGRTVQSTTRRAVNAAFSSLGASIKSTRGEVEASLASDAQHQQLVARHTQMQQAAFESARSDVQTLERWRDDQLRHIRRTLVTHRASSPELSRILVALQDIRVRDTVMWDLARAQDDRAHLGFLGKALVSAPVGLVAPIATCYGMLAWFIGDGVRATIALDRANTDDPGYRLAQLLGAALQAGLPPGEWRTALASMDEADLRAPTPIA